MKNIFLCLIIAISFILGGCKKKITQFYIDYTTKITIQSTVGQLVPFSLYTPNVTTNSEAEFESNNTKKEKINSIKLDELKLTITSPSNETFSFLNSIEVFISSPTMVESKIAFSNNIPDNIGNSISCSIVDKELMDFIKDDTFRVRIETITDETIPEDIEINLYTNFFVDAKLVRFK